MATKALHPVQNEALRTFVRALLAGHDNNQSELARRLGVKQGQVSEFLSGRKGAGLSLLGAISKYTGHSYDKLVSGDLDNVLVAGVATREESEWHRDDERYPNRAKAIVAWRALGRDEAVVEQIRQLQMQRAADATAEDWFADMEREERAMRRGAKAGPPVSENDVGGDADMLWRKK